MDFLETKYRTDSFRLAMIETIMNRRMIWFNLHDCGQCCLYCSVLYWSTVLIMVNTIPVTEQANERVDYIELEADFCARWKL